MEKPIEPVQPNPRERFAVEVQQQREALRLREPAVDANTLRLIGWSASPRPGVSTGEAAPDFLGREGWRSRYDEEGNDKTHDAPFLHRKLGESEAS